MKTKSGHEIQNFKKLEIPIDRHILEPHIYEGTIINLDSGFGEKDTYCTWDKFGRCSNFRRSDCFIDVSEAEAEIKPKAVEDIQATWEEVGRDKN